MEAEFLQKALETGTALAKPIQIEGVIPFAVTPRDYDLRSLEGLQKTPTRIKQNVSVFDADSFTKYFTDYCGEDSRIFVDIQRPSIIGVLDYHKQNIEDEPQPRWGDHRVTYVFRHTKEWSAWAAKDRQTFSQAAFAQFIEDNLPDIHHPAPATMVEISRTLEAKKSVDFSSATRLQSGEVQFVYNEEIKGTAAQGTIEVPQSFTLVLIPFEGSPSYKLEARLRYRIKESQLVMWYELVRPHKIIEDAVNDVVAKIRGGVNNPITLGCL